MQTLLSTIFTVLCLWSVSCGSKIPEPLSALPSFQRMENARIQAEGDISLAGSRLGTVGNLQKTLTLPAIIEFFDTSVQLTLEFWSWAEVCSPQGDVISDVGSYLASGMRKFILAYRQLIGKVGTMCKTSSKDQVGAAILSKAIAYADDTLAFSATLFTRYYKFFDHLGDANLSHWPFINAKNKALRFVVALARMTILSYRAILSGDKESLPTSTQLMTIVEGAYQAYESHLHAQNICLSIFRSRGEYNEALQPGIFESYLPEAMFQFHHAYQIIERAMKKNFMQHDYRSLRMAVQHLVVRGYEDYGFILVNTCKRGHEEHPEAALTLDRKTLSELARFERESDNLLNGRFKDVPVEALAEMLIKAFPLYWSGVGVPQLQVAYQRLLGRPEVTTDPAMTARMKRIRNLYARRPSEISIRYLPIVVEKLAVVVEAGVRQAVDLLKRDNCSNALLNTCLLILTLLLEKYRFLLAAEGCQEVSKAFPLCWDELYKLTERVHEIALECCMKRLKLDPSVADQHIELLRMSHAYPLFIKAATRILLRFSPNHADIAFQDVEYPRIFPFL